MAALPTPAVGQLVINGTSCLGPAWWVTDLTPLFQAGRKRNQNVTIPGVAGERPYMHRRHSLEVSLPMVFIGDNDAAGVATASQLAGLDANVAAFRAAVVDPVGAAVTGVVAATLTRFTGGTQTANVQVLDLTLLDTSSCAFWSATLDLIVPSGVFA